jgi:hypothetical protein
VSWISRGPSIDRPTLADRHRLAAWEAHWQATGPKWSRHR